MNPNNKNINIQLTEQEATLFNNISDQIHQTSLASQNVKTPKPQEKFLKQDFFF